eukprot:jgi/Antlo1/1943/115
MYLQKIVCIGMQVLCCLGTHPDEDALTVCISNEYEVMFFVDKKIDVVKKEYSVDMYVRWDREVFGRAVDMLGREQGLVGVEKMATILRAMASLRTDTESAHVHDTRGAVEIQWDRDTFVRAVEKLGERLQSNVDADKMEAILHAMAYQSTGKVDMLYVSDYMKRVAEWDGESHEIMWDIDIFEKAYNILIEKKQEKVHVDDMVEILHLIDYLSVQKEWEEACYGKLARKTKEDHKGVASEYTVMFVKKVVRLWKFLFSHVQHLLGLFVESKITEDHKEASAGYIEMFGKKVSKEDKIPRSFSLYTQHLLRLYAEEHGMSLTVDEKRKTLDLRRRLSKSEQGENRTGEWILRVEVGEEYRKQAEVQQLVEILMEVMDIEVEVDVRGYRPEDINMLGRIISKVKKTELRIRCRKVELE